LLAQAGISVASKVIKISLLLIFIMWLVILICNKYDSLQG